MTNTTQDRKVAAVQALHDKLAKTDKGHISEDRATIVGYIRDLDGVIRSHKWSQAVSKWALLVEDETHDVTWAYYQGSIWFNYQVM